MSSRWLKAAFFLMVALLGWMTFSAFRPDGNSDQRENAERQFAQSTIPERKPADNSVVVKKSRPETSTSSAVVAKADPKAKKAEKPAATKNGAVNNDPALHAMHQQAMQAAAPPRKAVDPKKPVSRDGYGIPILDWDILASTTVDDELKPTFLKKLADVGEQKVTLTGFMQPLNEVGEMGSFLLLEYPTGCPFCLTPSPTGLVHVDLAEGKRHEMVRELVKITGKLHLNSDSPEDFIYSIRDAELSLAE